MYRSPTEIAFLLAEQMPGVAPLEVLDMAMRGCAGHLFPPSALYPPSLFLDLVRRALDPGWSPLEMLRLARSPVGDHREWKRWVDADARHEALIVAFGQRYGIEVDGFVSHG